MEILDLKLKEFIEKLHSIQKNIKDNLKEKDLIDNNENKFSFFKAIIKSTIFQTIITTFIAYFFYIISYLFLYGYKSKSDTVKPLLEILINSNNDFKFRSVISLGIIFFLITIFAVLIYYIKKKKFWLALFLFIVVHCAVTFIFIGKDLFNVYKIIGFLVIWVVPSTILIFIKYMRITTRDFYSFLLAFSTLINLSVFIFSISKFNIINSIVISLSPLLLIFLTIGFNKLERKHFLWILYSCISFSTSISIVAIRMFNREFKLSGGNVIIFLVALILVSLGFYFSWSEKIINENEDNSRNDTEELEDKFISIIIHILNLQILDIIIILLVLFAFLIVLAPISLVNLGILVDELADLVKNFG